MKLSIHPNREAAGSAMVMSLILTIIAVTVLGSYLLMVRVHSFSVSSSGRWNSALVVAESGIEEALTHLNEATLNNLSKDGWTLQAGGQFAKIRTFGESYYEVTITASNPPVITSTGYVPAPLNTGGYVLGFLASIGIESPSTAVRYIPRTIRVTTANDGLFTKAMVAKQQINLNGNNIRTDSFDSTDWQYSTLGQYDPAKTKDGGDVATNSGLVNSLNVGNADIRGRVATGPGGSVSIGPNGVVGSKAWHESGQSGIQAGWSSDDMNVSFPDVAVPFTSGFSPQAGVSILGTNYTYYASSGNYVMPNLSLSAQNRMLIQGHVSLYVTNNVSVSGQASIIIAPGGSLKLYVGGPTASIAGNGIANLSGQASAFAYFGLPGNTSLSFSGNAAFTGVVYAPNAAFSLNGGGNNTIDFIGASVTQAVTMNGHFNFHYDEALQKSEWGRGFVVTSWNEL